jgi:hypothetical protein
MTLSSSSPSHSQRLVDISRWPICHAWCMPHAERMQLSFRYQVIHKKSLPLSGSSPTTWVKLRRPILRVIVAFPGSTSYPDSKRFQVYVCVCAHLVLGEQRKSVGIMEGLIPTRKIHMVIVQSKKLNKEFKIYLLKFLWNRLSNRNFEEKLTWGLGYSLGDLACPKCFHL